MQKFLWLAFSSYLLNGLSFVVFGAVMPMLLVHYHASYAAGGLLVFLQNGGYLVGVAAASWLPHRYSFRLIMSIASICMAIAQIGLANSPPYALAGVCAALNGIALSCTETSVATKIMELFVGRRAVIMSRLEAAFGIGALCMPLVASLLIIHRAWVGAFWIIGLLACGLALTWWIMPATITVDNHTGPRDAESSAPRDMTRVHKRYIMALFLVMMFLYVGVEASLNSFLPSMFIARLAEPPGMTSLSVSTMWVAMVIGRLLFGRMAQWISYARYLLLSTLLTCILLIGLTFTTVAFAAYAVVFAVGLMMSSMFALILVYANHALPGHARAVTSLLAGCAGVGGAVIPALTGIAMDHLTVVGVLSGITSLVLVMLVTLFLVQLRINAGTRIAEPIPLD